jgi:hypothetical protein
MHVNGKMRPVETTPGMGDGIKENGGGVNSTMIYLIHCKNFCKCHNVPQPIKKILLLKKLKTNFPFSQRLANH